MPTNIKILVSTLTLLLAAVTAFYQQGSANDQLATFVLGLGLFMALSLWIFPEPKVTRTGQPVVGADSRRE